MTAFTDGQLLRIFVNERDTWHGGPLVDAIVAVLKGEKTAGASVFRGIEGFGANREIHVARIWKPSGGLPILIEVVDRPEKIEVLLPRLEEMISEGAMTLEKVRYRRFGRNTSP